jgi:hypothetical protein
MTFDPEPESNRRRGRRLAAPALMLLVLLLLVLGGCGGGGDDSGTGDATSAEEGSTDTGGGGDSAAGGPGSLVSAGQDVFAQLLGGPGALEGVRDMEVVGTSVPVQEVVSATGFWIGTSELDRIFVVIEGQGGASFEVKEGDKVSFTGVMEPNLGAEEYGLREGQGAQQFRDQTLHVQVQAEDLRQG